MTEPTIICPNCKSEIRLTESLAAPLIAATRKQFEQQLSQKDEEIAKREQGIRDKEKQVAEAKRNLDAQVDQVAAQLKAERSRVIEEESKKAKQAAANELDNKARELAELQEVLKVRDAKLAEAQQAQAELIKKQRELDDAKRELELTVEKRMQEGLADVREKAKREAEEGLKLKVMEKDQTIASMQQKIEELKQKAEQGSQQLQGEVQELELENLLRAKFPFDSIEPGSARANSAAMSCNAWSARAASRAERFFGNPNAPGTGATAGSSSCARTSVPPKPRFSPSSARFFPKASNPSMSSTAFG
jgi:hypothetical protein